MKSRLRSTVVFSVLATPLLLSGRADAVVGGRNAAPGEFPEIAEVVLGHAFLCTGTLIDSTHVLTAGHCGSLTGAATASPISWPPALIDVWIGGTKSEQGEKVAVSAVSIPPSYVATNGSDISLLTLAAPSTKKPTKVAGASERALWQPKDVETIVGWGVTEEDGDLPDTLQKAKVPITTDAYCTNAYGTDFDPATMVCAGYPKGGVDTCQGDSGGPMFAVISGGTRRVVGTTSWGDGCAQPRKPGVYARVADSVLREWIRSEAPNGVAK